MKHNSGSNYVRFETVQKCWKFDLIWWHSFIFLCFWKNNCSHVWLALTPGICWCLECNSLIEEMKASFDRCNILVLAANKMLWGSVMIVFDWLPPFTPAGRKWSHGTLWGRIHHVPGLDWYQCEYTSSTLPWNIMLGAMSTGNKPYCTCNLMPQ